MFCMEIGKPVWQCLLEKDHLTALEEGVNDIQALAGNIEDDVNYIDAHAHVYSDDDIKYPPIHAPTRPIGTSGDLASLKNLASENRISRICVVQPTSFYGWDNRFVCDLALAEPTLIAAICTLNPEDDSSPALVKDLMKRYGIRGIRSLPASDGRIDHPGVRKLWRGCADSNITINVFIKYDKARELSNLLEEFTEVRCVIDHCLIPGSGPAWEEALATMLQLAQFQNAFAKVSFLPMASEDQYPYCDLHEACRKIIRAYTPRRCVWGSDFPCELWSPRSTYRQNLELFTSVLNLEAGAQEDILWNTPSRLWFDGR